MAPMTRVTYQYWTGTQWLPRSIEIGPVMTTGWHIFHIVMCFVFPIFWWIVYPASYLAAYSDKCKETDFAVAEVNRYYAKLAKVRDDMLRQTGMIE